MTRSKHIDFLEMRYSTEKFSHYVEIPYDFYCQNLEKIDNWLETNNQAKYTRIMISSMPVYYQNNAGSVTMRFIFIDPDDCFDFKMAWS